ncbi:MAG: protein ImuA [Cryomorphaceae bacterium]|jgi:protein ImuA
MISNNDQELEKLLEQHSHSLSGKIWRGSQTHNAKVKRKKVVDSGHPALNELLHSAAWPLGTTTEIGLANPGIGELRLLIPALRELTNDKNSQQNIIWVAPPFLPFAPSLIKEQIDVSKLTVVQTNNVQDTLWATEQALLAECCAAVLSWTGTYNLSTHQLRRLQLAAEKSNCWHILFRHSDCLKQSSTAGLRIHLKENTHSKLDLHILKQPQGWGGQRCTLSLQPHYERWQRLPVNLLPHSNQPHIHALPEQIQTLHGSDHEQASVTVLAPLSELKAVF